ncbi:hypothetical protein B0I35DRAFT_456756 [Stachybotrys elegans]|uniref:Uncharacterized protein n=1 Tax=Stachybotrys elegans TaxID=80388 RepID=A0A8K0WYY4_9HYPO|nr:hypothetical protein B0I35DRAFT_456756 [Stachybotrys elegans]
MREPTQKSHCGRQTSRFTFPGLSRVSPSSMLPDLVLSRLPRASIGSGRFHQRSKATRVNPLQASIWRCFVQMRPWWSSRLGCISNKASTLASPVCRARSKCTGTELTHATVVFPCPTSPARHALHLSRTCNNNMGQISGTIGYLEQDKSSPQHADGHRITEKIRRL